MHRLESQLSTALVAAACIAFVPGPAHAQDLSTVLGSWEMTMETPRGSMTQVFTFVEAGGALAGTASARMGESDLQNVSFEDGTLRFEVVRNFRGNSMTQSFSAAIRGAEMNGMISGGRGGERAFTAKRRAG